MGNKALKKAANISLGVFALLVAGALIFYRERMLLCDDAHIAFHIINQGSLQIQQLRVGAFITQWVPLVLAKLHMPLDIVLIGYSLSFNLFYFIIALILVSRFRTYELAVLMVFSYTLMTSDGFYWTNNEIYQGVAWMFLCLGYIFSDRQKSFVSVVLMLLVVGGMAVLTHPLVIVPFIFLLGFFMLDKSRCKYTRRQTGTLAVIGLVLVLIRIAVSSYGADYDKQLISSITAPSASMAIDLLKNTVKNFWLLPVLLVVGLITLLKQKRYIMVVWVCVFCLSYFIAVCMAFRGYLAFYTESELTPAIIFITAAFVFFTLPQMKQQQAVILLSAIFLVRLCYIGYSSQKFTARIQGMNNIFGRMQNEGVSKLVLLKSTDAADPLWMLDWGLSAETFLLSALNGDTVQRQFLVIKETEAKNKVPANNTEIIMTGHNIKASSLNAFYFHADTTQLYFTKPYNEYLR